MSNDIHTFTRTHIHVTEIHVCDVCLFRKVAASIWNYRNDVNRLKINKKSSILSEIISLK